jgi:3-phenylpropionate/trans-cinnamate dioxygenase ferredoxin component
LAYVESFYLLHFYTKQVSRGVFVESGYVRIAGKSEIALGKMKKITLDDKVILVANVNGNYYAVGNECTHYGGDLSEGVLEGKIVTCPNHKSRFDVTSGKVVSPPVEALSHPDIEDLPTYLVKIDNQDILVKV